MGVKFSQLPIASSVASDDYIAVLDTSESVLKRTPISHASSGSEYGLGTTQAYGHTKIVDNLSQSSLTSGEALSSRQGNVIANDMGVVELSTTAAHAHTAGDYFMLIGQFVKCTADIAIGDTINIGTNVTATNIGEVLSQLNSKTAIIGSSQIPAALGQTVTGALANIPFPFGVDSTTGEYGYYKAGADSVTPFKSGVSFSNIKVDSEYSLNYNQSTSFTPSPGVLYVVVGGLRYLDQYRRYTCAAIYDQELLPFQYNTAMGGISCSKSGSDIIIKNAHTSIAAFATLIEFI